MLHMIVELKLGGSAGDLDIRRMKEDVGVHKLRSRANRTMADVTKTRDSQKSL